MKTPLICFYDSTDMFLIPEVKLILKYFGCMKSNRSGWYYSDIIRKKKYLLKELNSLW